MSSRQYTSDKPSSLDKSLIPKHVWLISDGKPGHVSQLKGLANALEKLGSIKLKWLEANNLIRLGRKNKKKKKTTDSPQLIIGAGHSTHRHVLNFAKHFEAMSCILMSPTLPKSFFDCILCPEHDLPKVRENLLVTQGVINKISSQAPKTVDASSDGCILLGGPSKHFKWDQKSIVEQIDKILNHFSDKQWHLFNSRRTPESLNIVIEDMNKKYSGLRFVRVTEQHSTPISDYLSKSSINWVSPDSASMVYESLTAGCPTGILSLPPSSKRRPSKLANSILQLSKTDWVNSFEDWSETGSFESPPSQLNEAERAGHWLLDFYVKWKYQRNEVETEQANASSEEAKST